MVVRINRYARGIRHKANEAYALTGQSFQNGTVGIEGLDL